MLIRAATQIRELKQRRCKLLMVDTAHTLRDKAIIFLLAFPEGTIIALQLKHLQTIAKYNIFQITV